MIHTLTEKDNFNYELTSAQSLDDIALLEVDILVTGAHQDDEAFFSPFLFAQMREGKKVAVVTVTNGAGSNYKGGDGVILTPEELVELRNQESFDAAKYFGIEQLVLLGNPSSFVKDPNNLSAYANQIRAIIEATKPDLVLTHSPYDDHPTHIGVARGVIAAATQLNHANVKGYPVWGCLFGLEVGPDEPEAFYFSDEDVAKQVELFKKFPSQCDANAYEIAIPARQRFQAIMLDSHQVSGAAGNVEFLVDYSPLTTGEFEGTFNDYVPVLRRLKEVRETYQNWGQVLSRGEALEIMNSVLLPQVHQQRKDIARYLIEK